MKIILTCIFICVMMSSLAVAADSYPLHAAIQSGKPSRVRAELWSSRLNQRNYEDMTPLMVAARYDRSTSAGIVLEAGARVDEETYQYGTTALMIVAMNGYHEVVEVLLQYGAKVNECNKSGFTALMLAAQNGHTNVVHQLLQAGANPVLRDASNRTAKKHAPSSSLKYVLEVAEREWIRRM